MKKRRERTKKTLERVRELNKNPNPGTRKHKEKVFGKAYGDFDRLAKGVVENEDDDPLVNDEEDVMSPEEEEEFYRWAKLASNNDETERLIKERVRQHRDRLLTERKKKKKEHDCIGNKYHRGGTEDGETSKAGQFSSKEDAGSASIRKKNNTNCSPGTTRMPGRKWIKNVKDCGREGSMKYKCSTDNLKEWEIDSIIQSSGDDREETLRRVWDYMMDTKDDLDERVKKKKRGRPLADYSREEIRDICGRYNLMSLDQFLSILDRIERAKAGKIQNPNQPQ